MGPTCARCGQPLDVFQSVPSPYGPVHVTCAVGPQPAVPPPPMPAVPPIDQIPLPAYGVPPYIASPRIAPTEPMAMLPLYGAPPAVMQPVPQPPPTVGPTATPAGGDRLSPGAIAAVYLSVLVPGGALALIVVSSVLYYSWRGATPNRARQLNRHAWIAFVLGLVAWIAFTALVGPLFDEES